MAFTLALLFSFKFFFKIKKNREESNCLFSEDFNYSGNFFMKTLNFIN